MLNLFLPSRVGVISLCLLIGAVSALADDSNVLDRLPRGSTVSLPLDVVISAKSDDLELDHQGTAAGNEMYCLLNFEPSDQDRKLTGQLEMTVKSISDGHRLIPSKITLNGKPVKIRDLGCYAKFVMAPDDPDPMDISTGVSIGDLRDYLEGLGGTLTVPGPVPF